MKPRVAYILQDFHIGGMESTVYRIASRLRDRFEFFFIATHTPQILPKFHEIGTPLYVGRGWRELYRALRAHHIDLVQYGNLRRYADVALAAGVPVVIERTDGLRGGVALRSKAGLDAVIASTAAMVEPLAEHIDPARIHLIYNGVDLAHLNGVTPDRLGCTADDVIIGRASRFGRGKNLGLLIEAVRALALEFPELRLVLVGGNSRHPNTPDVESELRAQAADLGERVIFTGHLANPEAVIAGFDIGTCVSRAGNEGIPNSLLESMACGQAVIATAVDSIPELVEDGVSGMLIEDNDLDGLVAALRRLLTEPELRHAMGQAAHARIEQDFNLDVQAACYVELYEALLHDAQPRPLRRAAFWVRLAATLVIDAVYPRTFLRRVRGKLRAESKRWRDRR